MFITLEGPEGAGKTTLIRGLAERLRAEGRAVVTTREPGAGPVGGMIREILLGNNEIHPRAELLLFLADRAQHIEALIRPALAAGQVVLCDRHADSTVVYQGYGRGLDRDEMRRMNTHATGGLVPDLTLLLDVDPELGLQRQERADRLGGEGLEFHQRVREGFLSEAKREPTRWVVLNAQEPAPQVEERAWKVIAERLRAKA